MNAELITILAQFGPAGLIGLLWIAERRYAATRDRQLSESHAKLAVQDREVHLLVDVIKENTRAIATLEQTQRQLIDMARGLTESSRRSAVQGRT